MSLEVMHLYLSLDLFFGSLHRLQVSLFGIEAALSSEAYFFFLTDEFAMTQLRALVKLKGSSSWLPYIFLY